MRNQLSRWVGRRVVVSAFIRTIVEKPEHKTRVLCIGNVRFEDGTYVADHLWIRVKNKNLKIADKVIFSGIVVKYSNRTEKGVRYSDYGINNFRLEKEWAVFDTPRSKFNEIDEDDLDNFKIKR